MGRMFREFVHKIFTAVLGVGLGMTAFWYSREHHHNMWIIGGIAAAVTLIASVLFHPALFAWRHRPHRHVPIDEAVTD